MRNFIKARFMFPVMIGVLLTGLAIAVKITEVPLVSDLDRRLEWLAYDLRLRMLLPEDQLPDSRIVIVDIDEQSLLQEGRWPWSRSTIGKLVDRVFEADAAVMAMDVMYAEPQRSGVGDLLDLVDDATRDMILENVPLLESMVSSDQRLADALKNRSVVLGYVIASPSTVPKGLLPPPLVLDEWLVESLPERLPEMYPWIANIDLLQTNARSGGFFSIFPDDDGVIRSAPLFARHNSQLYGSLALEAVRQYLGAERILLNTTPLGSYQALESVSLDGLTRIPTDGNGYVLVPYRGGAYSFPYISSADVLNGDIPEGLLEDRIVLFGTTAAGLYDMRSTPVGSVYPGVEVHANIIAGLLDAAFPYEPSWALFANVALLAVLGVMSIFIVPFIGPVAVLLISLLMLVLVTGLNIWLWSVHGLVLALVAPLILITLIGIFDLAYGFLAEARGRRQLKAMFGQYVPPEVVDEMNKDPDGNFAVEGESREMSVLFCDIRSFTTISELLAANELKRMLNYFFTPMTRIIFERRGTIDKFVGDMIMAFWGAPVHDNEHRRHAVLGALEMLDKLADMQPEIEQRGWPVIEVGIGINSGMMNVGDMGSEYRRAYTVIGDAVNLGSRLESLTKYYGVRLIIGESTVEGLDNMVLRCLDRVQVKGKDEPVTIFEPAGEFEQVGEALRAEVQASNQALEYYFAGDWSRAEQAFSALASEHPGRKLYTLYLERIQGLREQGVSAGWDGVFRHTSK